uniref:VWFC domain-containing protein n=1 Tax=Myripristis murdjan TaxID=586833 RepID=A0A667ZFW1_9TELE
REYQSGSSFTPPSDSCSSCSCLNEVVTCQKRPCPVQCSHPVPSDTCCPLCDSCLYDGVVHAHRHTFTLSSNPCQRCTCGGEVRCSSPECPKLACMHQVTDPGACCPRCRGCVYDREEHAEGSSWFADSTPCMTCMCVDGVTTCSEVRCLSPCIQVKTPGKCCYDCQDSGVSCTYQGTVYQSNEQWEVDECTSCTCVSGDVHCHSERCPPLTCATVSIHTYTHTHSFPLSLCQFVLSPLLASPSHLHCLRRPSLPGVHICAGSRL